VTPKHRPNMRCFGDAIVRLLAPFLLRAPFLTVAEGPVSCAHDRYWTRCVVGKRQKVLIRRIDRITIMWRKRMQENESEENSGLEGFTGRVTE
jgi:hypothetical protein